MRVFLFLLLLAATKTFAQYDGPAVASCLAYAKREAAQQNRGAKDIVFERDNAMNIERYTRKAGSQFVSSVLTGNGAVVLAGAPSAELSFICLLANEKQPVFFQWLPRGDASASKQCIREGGKAQPCLDVLLRTAESDLVEHYAVRLQEANQRGAASLAAYRKSNDAWREYRDAECGRRRDAPPAGLSAEDAQTACLVDLTRRRALDVR